jgi:MYXO-CTERM domain-containing protein
MFDRPSLKSKSLAVTATVTLATVGLVVLAAPRRAEAQITGTGGTTITGTGGSGGTAFAAGDFFTAIQQQTTPPVSLTTFDLSRFFNKANCDCSTPVNVFIALLGSGIAKRATAGITTGTVSIVLGTGCSSVYGLQTGQAAGACLQIASEPVLTFLNQAFYTVPTDARTLSTYFNSTGVVVDAGATTTATTTNGTATACTSPIGQSFTQTINFNFDFGDGTIDLSIPFMVLVDLVPPPAPTGLTIRGGDEALVLNWQSVDQAIVPDLLGYQILCSRAGQYQVFKEVPNDAGGTSSGPFGAAFQTCPATRTGIGVEGLDPQFICSGLLSAQATSDRVEILQNDITYAAAVVAIDNSGNPSEPMVGYGAPIKTLSFYDVYRDQTPQGGATGGFCAVSTTRPGAKTTAAALGLFAVIGLGAVITRRRRRRR